MIGILRALAVSAALILVSLALQAAPTPPPKAQQGPRVVRTEPATGDKSVDPALSTLRITFSEPMQPNEYYLGPVTGRELPEWGAPVSLSPDGLTFSVPITLKPGRKYGIVINPAGHPSFKSATGKPAQTATIFFNTADQPVAGATRAAETTAAAPAVPETFRIISPADGSEVRDRVVVTVPAAAVPEGAFVSFFINGTFVVGEAAAKGAETVKFEWDTKAPLPGTGPAEKRIPKDGPYTIRAELHGAGQSRVSEVKVVLRNTLNPPEAAEGFQLRYQFAAGDDLEYYQQFESRIKAPGTPLTRQRGEIISRLLVEEKLEDGSFALVGRFGKAVVEGVEYTGSDLANKWGVGRSIRFDMDTQGMIKITSKKGRPLVEVISHLLPLPNRRVKLNETWESTLVLPEVLKGKMAVAPAKHTIEGVVWEGGHETVVIASEYQVSGLKDPEPSKYLILALGSPNVPPGGQLAIRGKRYTYFAYKIGRVMRVADQKTIRLILTQAPAAAGGMGMPGAPGMEAMGMPGGMGGMPGGATGGRPQRQVYDIEATEVIEFVPPTTTEG